MARSTFVICRRYQRRAIVDNVELNAPEEDADFADFQEITRGFIFDGSPDEVNIR